MTAKFSAEELAEDIGRGQAFPRVLLGHRIALVIPGETSQNAEHRLQLPVTQLIEHGVRGFLQFLSIHALIVADSHVRVGNTGA